jgi:hypothetical protein
MVATLNFILCSLAFSDAATFSRLGVIDPAGVRVFHWLKRKMRRGMREARAGDRPAGDHPLEVAPPAK